MANFEEELEASTETEQSSNPSATAVRGALSGAGDSGRLSPLTTMFDTATIALLERLGVAPGWHCLEVGAGAGSIATWLATRVGSGGRVLATDLDLSLLSHLRGPPLEVLRHDLSRDPLPPAAFDLVHARLVLEHLAAPVDALCKLLQALRPGGVILVEDLDWDTAHPVSENGAEAYRRATAAMRALWSSHGYHPTLGAALPLMLGDQGCIEVGCQVWGRPLMGGSDEALRFFGGTLRQLAPLFLQRGLLTRTDIARGLVWARKPDCAGMPPLLVSCWGRRPAAQASQALNAGGHP